MGIPSTRSYEPRLILLPFFRLFLNKIGFPNHSMSHYLQDVSAQGERYDLAQFLCICSVLLGQVLLMIYTIV